MHTCACTCTCTSKQTFRDHRSVSWLRAGVERHCEMNSPNSRNHAHKTRLWGTGTPMAMRAYAPALMAQQISSISRKHEPSDHERSEMNSPNSRNQAHIKTRLWGAGTPMAIGDASGTRRTRLEARAVHPLKLCIVDLLRRHLGVPAASALVFRPRRARAGGGRSRRPPWSLRARLVRHGAAVERAAKVASTGRGSLAEPRGSAELSCQKCAEAFVKIRACMFWVCR